MKEAATVGSQPPNWGNRPERFMLLKDGGDCALSLFQLEEKKKKKEKDWPWLVRSILRIQIMVLR